MGAAIGNDNRGRRTNDHVQKRIVMSHDIPAQAILAVATVVASLITGMIALVNLTLSKEQKVSEFRQDWIDGLRDDLAKFASLIRFLAAAAQSSAMFVPEVSQQNFPRTPEQIAQFRALAGECLSRIELRLNPDEADHVELLRLLRRAAVASAPKGPAFFPDSEALTALSAAMDFARPVLKSEWNRVKAGEPIFRRLRVWVLPAILVLSLALGGFLPFGSFHY